MYTRFGTPRVIFKLRILFYSKNTGGLNVRRFLSGGFWPGSSCVVSWFFQLGYHQYMRFLSCLWASMACAVPCYFKLGYHQHMQWFVAKRRRPWYKEMWQTQSLTIFSSKALLSFQSVSRIFKIILFVKLNCS